MGEWHMVGLDIHRRWDYEDGSSATEESWFGEGRTSLTYLSDGTFTIDVSHARQGLYTGVDGAQTDLSLSYDGWAEGVYEVRDRLLVETNVASSGTEKVYVEDELTETREDVPVWAEGTSALSCDEERLAFVTELSNPGSDEVGSYDYGFEATHVLERGPAPQPEPEPEPKPEPEPEPKPEPAPDGVTGVFIAVRVNIPANMMSVECYEFTAEGTVHLRHAGKEAITDTGEFDGADITWSSGRLSHVVDLGDRIRIDGVVAHPGDHC